MKTTVSQKAVSSAINTIRKSVRKNSTVPILSHALIRAQCNGVCISGTDLEVYCSVSVPGLSTIDGAVCVPANRLNDIIKTCHHDVELESNDKSELVIRNGSNFSLAGLSQDEFPVTPAMPQARQAAINVYHLRKHLARIEHAISSDAARYVLNGVLLRFNGDALTMVATDGRRIAIAETLATTKMNDGDATAIGELRAQLTAMRKGTKKYHWLANKLDKLTSCQFIIPTKAVSVLLSSLPKVKNSDVAEVCVQWTGDHAAFTFNNAEQTIQIQTRLVQGDFPNYKMVIPQDCKEQVIIPRESFLQAVNTAAKLTSEKSNSVKLSFSENLLTVTSNSPECGNAACTVAIAYLGKQFSIAFNPRYLGDAIAATDTDIIVADFVDELSPVKITTDGAAFITVIMPMRLS